MTVRNYFLYQVALARRQQGNLCSLRIKLSPVYRRLQFTLSFLLLYVKQGCCKYQFLYCLACPDQESIDQKANRVAARLEGREGPFEVPSHLMTCKFQSVLFLTDSQSALSILFSAPSYILPESLWNVWSLASSLSNNTTLSFQWVPGHAGLPGNEKADLLAKTGATLPTDAIPSPLPPVIAKVRYSQYRNWRRHISHSHLKLPSPRSLFGGTSSFSLHTQ